MATGFSFLQSKSGFAINQLPIHYTEDSTYFRAFLVGLVNTIIVSFLGIVTATILGFLVAIARLSQNYILNRLATAYIEILRNLPLLLLIFFFYFVVIRSLPLVRESWHISEVIFLNNRGLYLPALIHEPGSWIVVVAGIAAIILWFVYSGYVNRYQLKTGRRLAIWPVIVASMVGVAVLTLLIGTPFSWEFSKLGGFNFNGGIVVSPEFLSLYAALSCYTASFIAENVRSGILAVPKGQLEAARSLGLKRSVTLRKIVIPQAMRVIIPPMTNQYLNLTKNSSLAATIGYPELFAVFGGTVLNQTGQAVEVLAITMGVYLFLSLTTSLVMNIYNKNTLLTER